MGTHAHLNHLDSLDFRHTSTLLEYNAQSFGK